MRKAILAVLLVAQTSAVAAQTIGDAVYTAHQQQQIEDYWSLTTYHEMFEAFRIEHGPVSEASDYDQAMLFRMAADVNHIVNQMRARGKNMFSQVEENYINYCLHGQVGPLSCSHYKITYLAMVADTLMLGSVYQEATAESGEILSHLK